MLAPADTLTQADVVPASDLGLGIGWQAFLDLGFITSVLLILAAAVALAGVIAYHPTTRAKASTIEEIEQPKTFIMYSLVGAIIAIIVKVQPSMALVVFGIGGLMRFRTNVGQAKDTGRVILVTVIGLSCGLELYIVAVLTTVIAWALIFVLERQSIERVVVQGLDKDSIQRASDAYVGVLRGCGCAVIGEQKRVNKGSLAIIYRAPRGFDRGALERGFAEIPEDARGTISWETA
ncbi:hypothetical protein ENSA5_04500 [Enhygromyxa salina]|uniref:DUF4956 domain-containing protein n=1 Tax=Enhygromyxa salina TaxID=215803 RepID=A0A2S9YIU0_9BACT|nr:hypothetical protein [Enhygromyxa salina]PRQ05024.1 hypothetical protein ENSA5_04500 [Enhygromyxa salina]